MFNMKLRFSKSEEASILSRESRLNLDWPAITERCKRAFEANNNNNSSNTGTLTDNEKRVLQSCLVAPESQQKEMMEENLAFAKTLAFRKRKGVFFRVMDHFAQLQAEKRYAPPDNSSEWKNVLHKLEDHLNLWDSGDIFSKPHSTETENSLESDEENVNETRETDMDRESSVVSSCSFSSRRSTSQKRATLDPRPLLSNNRKPISRGSSYFGDIPYKRNPCDIENELEQSRVVAKHVQEVVIQCPDIMDIMRKEIIKSTEKISVSDHLSTHIGELLKGNISCDKQVKSKGKSTNKANTVQKTVPKASHKTKVNVQKTSEPTRSKKSCVPKQYPIRNTIKKQSTTKRKLKRKEYPWDQFSKNVVTNFNKSENQGDSQRSLRAAMRNASNKK